MATQEQLIRGIEAAEKAGDTQGAMILAQELGKLTKGTQERGIGERYMAGLKAGAQRGYLGAKGVVTELTPEELIRATKAKREIEAGGIPGALGAATFEAPAYLAASLAVPGSGIPAFAARTGLAGLVGATLAPTDRAQSGLMSAAGQVLGEAVPYAAASIKRGLEPFYSGGQELIVGRMIKRQAGDKADEIAKRLTSAQELVPGSKPTAAEAAQPSGGLAALQRWAEQAAPEEYAFRRMQSADARKAALEKIAGTEMEKAQAIASRESATRPMYEAAKAQLVPVDEELMGLLQRPSMSNALSEAASIAAEQGDPVSAKMVQDIMEQAKQGYISGEGLHLLKIGLDSLRSTATTSLSKQQQNALKGTIDAFEGWRAKNIPEYAAAQSEYARLSKPISQQQIGQALYEKAVPALAEYGPLTAERAAMYANALRSGDKIAQTATGFKGARLTDIMDPAQMQSLESVAADLSRRSAADVAGRGIGSNTFQNLAMQNLAERAGFPATMFGALGKMPLISYGMDRAEQEMRNRLASALLDPAETARLMRMRGGPLTKLLESQYLQPTAGSFGAAMAQPYGAR